MPKHLVVPTFFLLIMTVPQIPTMVLVINLLLVVVRAKAILVTIQQQIQTMVLVKSLVTVVLKFLHVIMMY